ncbi:hypothetical protein SAMN05216241_11920 [Limimonas halophila]|uniref:Uncharacterized protein n=1 Tax=Limimonas halophila TaxID=1082479 RepID=A0A1G7V179_9PROT|nr:hypothetical protein [Limimonas halophila]SDG53474.1 hypothetical protein SAMN05216241_11920 [Limimonas halophila]
MAAAAGGPAAATPPALVIFAGRAELGWLRVLKPGFRHCFAAVHDGHGWILYDPLSHATDIRALPPATAEDLAAWFRARGHTVVAVPRRRVRRRPAPWGPFTCVEALKRLLGIRARRVWTPWQLYRHLRTPGGYAERCP